MTLNNIRTREQLAARLARQLEADSAAWMEAFRSPEVLDELNLDTLSVFMIFPARHVRSLLDRVAARLHPAHASQLQQFLVHETR